jgi:hypothetical protein
MSKVECQSAKDYSFALISRSIPLVICPKNLLCHVPCAMCSQVLQEEDTAGLNATPAGSGSITPPVGVPKMPVQHSDVIDLTGGDFGRANAHVAAVTVAAPTGAELSDGGLSVSQRGCLRCLLELGHLQNLLTLVAGWSIQAPGGHCHDTSLALHTSPSGKPDQVSFRYLITHFDSLTLMRYRKPSPSIGCCSVEPSSD